MNRGKIKAQLSKDVRVPVLAFGGMILLIVLMIVLLWSTKRRQSTRPLHVAGDRGIETLLPSIANVCQGSVDPGNRVEILQNGSLFPSLLADIAAAKSNISFESFVWWKGAICDEIAAALSARAREGVEVHVLLDASGSSRMDDKLLSQMKEAGCEVHKFHPVRFSNLGRLNNRDHRKIFVIDGRIGYVGGHGIAEEWTGNAQDKKHWRDTFLRIEGPVVQRLQAAFSENWTEETGQVLIGEKYFPSPAAPAGNTIAHVAYTSPFGRVSSVQLLYYLAISAATKKIWIQNPYFLPDPEALEALDKAVERGVDVRVMVPAAEVNDSPVVQHASHHHYGTLLKKGVRIYEYNKTLLHQKIIIVDGVWSCVGSTNFDDRSFDLNDEITLGLYDPAIAAQLEAAFNDDLRHTTQIQLESWRKRPWSHKLKDGLAYTANEQL